MHSKGLLYTMLKLSKDEIYFEKRGFAPCQPEVQTALEKILAAFVEGYNLTLAAKTHQQVVSNLDAAFDAHHVGFAYEGSGLCFAVKDLLKAWKKGSELRTFTTSHASKHDYIMTVGAGFAFARLPIPIMSIESYMKRLDPMLAWCVPDGYGFHDGFFHHKKTIDKCGNYPRQFPEYMHQLYDSGVGRSMWWVKGAQPHAIKAAIDAFPEARRAEMWCGIGVAAAYAGGVGVPVLHQLTELAGPYHADLMCGVPFATVMRMKGQNPSDWTEQACQTLLGMPTTQASAIILSLLAETNANWPGTEEDKMRHGYNRVREKLKQHFAMTIEV